MSDQPRARLSVDHLMRDIEDEVRRARRARLLAPGGSPDYADPDTFALVDRTIRRALEDRDPELLLLPELLGDEHDWLLETKLRFSSHRPVVGPLIMFFKRRVLFPLMYWLYEYCMENFRRQQRVNTVLFACIEELAIDNARLRRDLTQRADGK